MALSNLTKVQTLGIGSNIEVVGVITTGQFKSGTSNLHSSGVELTNLNVSGIATIGGNVSIGGTLTYQDVTNIDSVGIITARSTIDAQGSINLADSIIHTGNTDTKIKFPVPNTVTVETGGSERVRISSNGLVNIGAGSSASGLSPLLHLHKNASNSSAYFHITNNDTGITNNDGFLLGVNPSGDCLVFNKDSTPMRFATAGSERLRITSAGDVGIGVNDPDAKLEVLEDIFVKGSSGDGDTGIQIRSGSSALSNQHQIRTGGGNGNMLFLEAVGGTGIIAMKTAGSERLRIDSNGRLLVGTTSTNSAVRAVFQGYHGGGDDYQARVQFQTNQQTNLALNQHLANLLFTNSSGSVGAEIRAIADGAWGTNDYPGRLEFYTTPDGSNTSTERMRLQSNGYMALNTTGAQRLFSVKESNNKASILIWRTSETNGDYSGIDFIGHPSNNGTNYQKGGIYWQTDGSGFGRGDMVFCNDGAADSDNVIISNEKLRIHKEGPVTKPNMPVASFSDSRAVNISNAILTSSNFYNHQWWNEGSHFNTSNGRFTCPVDGVYRIYFRATCDTNEHTNVRLRKNGATINEAYANYSSGQTSSDSSEAIMHCSTNDYLEIQVSRLKTSGGTQHKQVTFQLLH